MNAAAPDAAAATAATGAANPIGRYLANLTEQRQLSPHTVSNYARDLQELTALVQTLPTHEHDPQAGQPPYAIVSHAHIRKFAKQKSLVFRVSLIASESMTEIRRFWTPTIGEVQRFANRQKVSQVP